ncbi:6,7-dimethyl-8-ribityllumazine synthase [Candidatus Nasuia deltocephalinicola str. NAS-ALF]|uniref:6,7-dimethyl-8-ribityllumazine synthase n=1 Tax=Candidatus Nasuia deltocephalinicola str. NAS-ALF TaxID=1343077 RepID=S5SQB9_9PROT|nr:6,7-dimethyl-8-ribityllumazine synthase [Candidatus Nasuia deltocephalinicola str. NAS-ALF]
MILLYNYIIKYYLIIKFLLIISNFNKIFSKIFLNIFYRKILNFGFLKSKFLIILIKGSIETYFLIKILLLSNIFDVFLIFGVILKNKTLHYDLICINFFYLISNLYIYLNLIFINFLLISNNIKILTYKFFNFNIIYYKNILQFINFTNFINLIIF